MKKSLLLGLLLICGSWISIAQDLSKLNLQLVRMINDPELQNTQVNLLVQGDIDMIKTLTESHGGLFRYSVGNIATVKIPVYAILQFSTSDKIKRIESPSGNYMAMNDSMRSTVRANQVHAGLAPLPHGYNGTGVVIGIIDTGVDLTHPDLQDSSGN
ncbi:MAG TPA: hypothetical protein PKD91_00630, partial [Bacteroidia bacterium]|nr:hypothetical protein [Bacteroidia bacterium]